MIVGGKGETCDEVCTKAHNEKSAESQTWYRVFDQIIWKYFLWVFIQHVALVVGFYMYLFGLYSVPIKRETIIWVAIVYFASALGVTAGAHRLWTHRSYKAKLPLRILLMVFYTTGGANPLYYWIRDHRVHHRYSETDADPHNAKRGFFFSHIGWVIMERHPECIRRGKEIDMSDIEADPVVMFQKKYSNELRLLLCFVIPTAIPIIFWGETFLHAALTQCVIRYLLAHNATFSVNSVAHLWGNRPYNRLINPAENGIVSLLTLGEGSHNYHHTFPWDYKTSEFPYLKFNTTTLFIDAMAKLGWAYDRREPSPELVEKVVRRIGYKSKVDRHHSVSNYYVVGTT